MPRTVLLRHDLPDGSHHFDWLLETGEPGRPVDPDVRSLIAWRLPASLCDRSCAVFDAERLAPHRRLYLDYEGEVSGGRGAVRRVAAGEVALLLDGPSRFEARFTLASRQFRVWGEPSGSDRWRLRVEAAASGLSPEQ